MSKKNSLALFLVLVIISSASSWTPENGLQDIREFYTPVEIDNGNGTWTLQYQGDSSGGFTDAVINIKIECQINKFEAEDVVILNCSSEES